MAMPTIPSTETTRTVAALAVACGALLLSACQADGPVAPTGESSPAASSEVLDISFVEITSEPFGTFDGVAFVRHTGMFEGETSLGAFRVPFEIVAPQDPSLGSGTVLVEPPHWAFPATGREFVLGRDIVFGSGMSYASVGFGTDGRNILDFSVTDAVIAGEPVDNPGRLTFSGVSDEEILVQFTRALTSRAFAAGVLGSVDRIYAYGISQTADVLMETLMRITGTASADLFDLTVMHGTSWTVEVEGVTRPGGPLQFLAGGFTPPPDVGPVLFVHAEGDLVIFDSEQFRAAVGLPDYRVYEVPGGAHLPTAENPLDHWAVARAVFVAGDAWVRRGDPPAASRLIAPAPAGQIDPVYADDPRVDSETGIARDADLNARGGVRMPDLEVGRAQYIASDPGTPTLGIPGLEPLSGSFVDLACEPEPDSDTDEPRFRSHGDYVHRIARQANELVREGFLLEDDAEALKDRAAESEVGKPGSCEG